MKAPKSTAPFHIRPMRKGEITDVLHLAASLEKFFPKNSLTILEALLKSQPTVVGTSGDNIIGFLIYTLRDRETAEILWMGVHEDYHGFGLGTLLLETLENTLDEKGIKKLLTSTLSYTASYKPYEKVRTFYYHRGFRSIGMERNYYELGLDRLILFKDLSKAHSGAR